MANDIAALGYEIDSSQAISAGKNLDAMNAAAARADKGARSLAASSAAAEKSVAKFSNQGRMIALQLNQVTQQGLATGQWAQAFAIQAGDIALAFGTVGAAIGIVLPLVVNLGATFLSAGKNAEEFERAVKDLKDETKSATDEYQAMVKGFSNVGQLTLFNEITRLQGEIAKQQDIIANGNARQQRNARATVGVLNEQIEANQRLIDENEVALQKLSDASFFLGKNSEQTSDWEYRMQGVRVEIESIQALLASIGGGAISAAAKQAEISALQAGKSVKEAAQAAAVFKQNLEVDAQVSALESRFGAVGKVMGSVLRGQAEYNQELDATLEKEREAAREREREAKKAASAAKKGALRLDPKLTSQRLQTLIDSLRTEQEQVDAWYEQSKATLDNRKVQELLGQEAHNEAKLALERTYQEKLRGIQASYQGNGIQQTERFMGDMAAALSNGNEKMVKISQVFASVEALINAYRAYNQVLADPSLPWFAKIPAAVGVLAAGMKTVSAIKSLSSSGGSGGGSSTPSSVSGTTTTTEPERVVRIDLVGDDWAAGILEPIIEKLYEASSDGARVIVQR